MSMYVSFVGFPYEFNLSLAAPTSTNLCPPALRQCQKETAIESPPINDVCSWQVLKMQGCSCSGCKMNQRTIGGLLFILYFTIIVIAIVDINQWSIELWLSPIIVVTSLWLMVM